MGEDTSIVVSADDVRTFEKLKLNLSDSSIER